MEDYDGKEDGGAHKRAKPLDAEDEPEATHDGKETKAVDGKALDDGSALVEMIANSAMFAAIYSADTTFPKEIVQIIEGYVGMRAAKDTKTGATLLWEPLSWNTSIVWSGDDLEDSSFAVLSRGHPPDAAVDSNDWMREWLHVVYFAPGEMALCDYILPEGDDPRRPFARRTQRQLNGKARLVVKADIPIVDDLGRAGATFVDLLGDDDALKRMAARCYEDSNAIIELADSGLAFEVIADGGGATEMFEIRPHLAFINNAMLCSAGNLRIEAVHAQLECRCPKSPRALGVLASRQGPHERLFVVGDMEPATAFDGRITGLDINARDVVTRFQGLAARICAVSDRGRDERGPRPVYSVNVSIAIGKFNLPPDLRGRTWVGDLHPEGPAVLLVLKKQTPNHPTQLLSSSRVNVPLGERAIIADAKSIEIATSRFGETDKLDLLTHESTRGLRVREEKDRTALALPRDGKRKLAALAAEMMQDDCKIPVRFSHVDVDAAMVIMKRYIEAAAIHLVDHDSFGEMDWSANGDLFSCVKFS